MKGTTRTPSIVALSDDLTGSFGLSILIADENVPVRALTAMDESYDAAADRGRAVVVNTETRAVGESEARRVVTEVVRRFPDDTIIAKRFDTTLRGHVGAELAAVMEQRPDAAAIVVPSYPASGRLCIGGYQQLNGVPIERTEVATDPRWPISDSHVPSYFTDAGPVVHISLSEVNAGEDALAARLQAVTKAGTVVVVDAYSDSDIATIARATQSVETELIYTAPGVFIAAAVGLRYRPATHRITLVANGSTTDQTRDQVAALEQKYAVRYFDIPLDAIADGSVRTVTAGFVATWSAMETDVLVIRPERARAERSLQPKIVAAIAEAMNTIAGLDNLDIAGVILSGGETGTGVLQRFGASSIRPEVEFGSLIMGGTMIDGRLAGTRIVTKGGLVGDRSIFLRACTWFLKENIS